MLTKIAIENFKGIGERVELDLAPITLLFGANSAGKSSIIHALHYAREVLLNGNLNAHSTETGGGLINLGGFKSFNFNGKSNEWNNKQPSKRSIKIYLETEVNLSPDEEPDDDLIPYFDSYERVPLHPNMKIWMQRLCTSSTEKANISGNPTRRELLGDDGEHEGWNWSGLFFYKDIKTLGVEIEIDKIDDLSFRHSNWNNTGVSLKSIKTFVNSQPGISIKLDKRIDWEGFDGWNYWLDDFNFSNDVLPDSFWSIDNMPNRNSANPLRYKEKVDIDNRSLRDLFKYYKEDFERGDKYERKTERQQPLSVSEYDEESARYDHIFKQYLAFCSSYRELIPGWKFFALQYSYSNRPIGKLDLLNRHLINPKHSCHLISPLYNLTGETEVAKHVIQQFQDAGWTKEIIPSVEQLSRDCAYSFNAMVVYSDLFFSLPLLAIKNELVDFRYLGPLRNIPTASAENADSQKPETWADGAAAWDILRNSNDFDGMIDWINKEDGFNCGFHITRHEMCKIDRNWLMDYLLELIDGDRSHEPEHREEVINEISSQIDKKDSLSYEIFLISKVGHGPVNLSPKDVGTGVSQVIPAIVMSLEPSTRTLAIEQPELHLHPKLQAELGDAFIESIRKNQKGLLLETHSEHLILRLLRRIRESHQGKAKENAFLKTNDIAVYHVSQVEGMAKARRIHVDINGEFIEPWPDDFFEIDFYERFS